MIDIAKLFFKCENNVLQNLMDYYNLHCFDLVKPERKYRIKYGDNWCAMFVSVVAHISGKTDFPFEVSVLEQTKLASDSGSFYVDKSKIKPNDLVVFNWNGDFVPDHIGIIESFDGDTIVTIEGNKSNSVNNRTLSKNSGYIMGFIRT